MERHRGETGLQPRSSQYQFVGEAGLEVVDVWTEAKTLYQTTQY